MKHWLPNPSTRSLIYICNNLMPQVAAEGVAFRDEWPFAIHLLGHIYADDINSARFLWKSIPAAIKESQPELVLQPGKLGLQVAQVTCKASAKVLTGYAMTEVVVKVVKIRKDKEMGLRITSKDGNLDLLPKGNCKFPVQSEHGELDLEIIQADGDSRIIRGEGWKDFIRHYQLGAIVTLYLDENGSFKLQARK
ncbi:Uncharacterized protein TCM_030771 [Theobroma cacao]|uniref:TF-B3 domain-containing protein n=1 Tax=Theobroma cacao TaxID=3641 RepID=A0A061FCL6_THECC|nr:Uncharacterized protein TCM_030771 [Theobroma cacao]